MMNNEQFPSFVNEMAEDMLMKDLEQMVIRRQTEYVPDPRFDDIGLPVESVKYAKSSCKKCHGRGYAIVWWPKSVMVLDIPVNRQHGPCPCQNRGYDKIRKSLNGLSAEAFKSKMAELKAFLS